MRTSVGFSLVIVGLILAACGSPNTADPSTTGQDGATADIADAGQAVADAADSGVLVCGRLDETLRLHQIQAKATHNSYHIAQPIVAELDYEHSPLDVQLSMEGVRSFELDIHPPENPPGALEVYHIPGIDQTSNCGNFRQCLAVLRAWSDAHPCHHALLVIVEPKDVLVDSGEIHEKEPLDDYWDQFDADILAAWPRERVVTPDDVRGKFAGLREAVTTVGWPTLGQTRGKLVVFLMDKDGHGAWYKKGHPQSQGRAAFVFGPADATDTAAVQHDGVKTPEDAGEVQALVKQGFMVRSFADPPSASRVPGETTYTQRALGSGAQMLSTDFPVSKPRLPGFVFDLPGGTPSRCNPVNAPQDCLAADVENLTP